MHQQEIAGDQEEDNNVLAFLEADVAGQSTPMVFGQMYPFSVCIVSMDYPCFGYAALSIRERV